MPTSATREDEIDEGADPDDGEPFADKMTRLAAQWRTQQAEAAKLDSQIEANLQSLGF